MPLEKHTDLLPSSKDDPLSVYAINTETGEETSDVKYTLHLEEIESLDDGLIIYRKLRIEKMGQNSKILHFIHYTAWPDRRVISDDNLMRLIDIVDQHQIKGNTMFVHCQNGHGRTGTFITAREIYETARKEKTHGMNWFQKAGAGDVDPIEQYVKYMRTIRWYMVDRVVQFEFLYGWAIYVQRKLKE